MPPRKKARGPSGALPTASRDDDGMDIDTSTINVALGPKVSSSKKPELEFNAMWTDDQVASLFKAVIRWKPAGMHKHFRMIAISEHLRNHGFDPNAFPHTRIPHIWDKLRSYYNLDIVDDREYFDDDELAEKYVDFTLPPLDFLDMMRARALAGPSEAPSSPPELDLSPSPSRVQSWKTKRAATASKGKAADREDTEDVVEVPPPVARGPGRPRGRPRTVTQPDKTAKKTSETTEEEESENGEEDDEVSDSEAEEEDGSAGERGTPTSRSTRAAARKSAAPKPAVRRTRSRRFREKG